MAKYINPFTDEGFKRIFGQEEHKSLLIAFLNRLFDGEMVVTDVTYKDKESLPKDHDEGKRFVYDINCELDTGEHIIVEMQNKQKQHFKERTAIYASRALDRQSKKGDGWKYRDLRPVFSISFMNFKMDDFPDELLVDGQIRDRKTGKLINMYLRFIYIQLPVMTKSLEECETFFEKWIYILKNIQNMQTIPTYLKDTMEEIKYFEKVMDEASMTQEERIRYERSLKYYLDEMDSIEYYEAKGEREGILKTAAKMKELGISADLIAEATGLSMEMLAEV